MEGFGEIFERRDARPEVRVNTTMFLTTTTRVRLRTLAEYADFTDRPSVPGSRAGYCPNPDCERREVCAEHSSPECGHPLTAR